MDRKNFFVVPDVAYSLLRKLRSKPNTSMHIENCKPLKLIYKLSVHRSFHELFMGSKPITNRSCRAKFYV